jgi:hypothetical protein
MVLIAGSFALLGAWAVWVVRDARAARRTGTRSQAPLPPEPCHVTGCPFPGFVTLHRVRHGVWEVIFMCHGHADETTVKGDWMRERGWRVAS